VVAGRGLLAFLVVAVVAPPPAFGAPPLDTGRAAKPARPSCVYTDEGTFDTGGLRAPVLAKLWPSRSGGDRANWTDWTDPKRPDASWRLPNDIPSESMAVARCRSGRGRLYAYTPKGKSIEGFPTIGRGERVAGLSQTGRYVAWRTWRSGRPGRLSIARYDQRNRLGRVRSVRIPVLPRAAAHDPRLAVTRTGGVLWTLRRTARRDRTWHWPAGGRPRVLVPSAPRGGDLLLFDDAHVLMGDATSEDGRLVAFARGTAATCRSRGGDGPAATVRHLGLGSRCVRETSLPEDPEGDEGSTTEISNTAFWVYDPRTHRVRATRASLSSGDRYTWGCSCLNRWARHGTLVAAEDLSWSGQADGGPSSRSYGTRVTTSDGTSYEASGALVRSGELPPRGFRPFEEAGTPSRVAVAIGDGAIAWVEDRPRQPSLVHLRDADGTRVVGDLAADDPVGIAFAGTGLRWTSPAGAVEVAVRPEVGVPQAAWGR
jgi:hypothetical protein